MGGGGFGAQLSGPPPPELSRTFEILRMCVLSMMAGLISKFLGVILLGGAVTALLMDSINLILNTVVGIFLLNDDPFFNKIYAFFLRTCCQGCADQCGGGMSCLMSFIICNLFTILMQVFLPSPAEGTIGQLIAEFKMIFEGESSGPIAGLGLALFAVGTLAAFLGQILGCWFGWKAYQAARDRGVTGQGGDWERSGGGAPINPRAQDQQQAREARPAAGFLPFQGGGTRLGS